MVLIHDPHHPHDPHSLYFAIPLLFHVTVSHDSSSSSSSSSSSLSSSSLVQVGAGLSLPVQSSGVFGLGRKRTDADYAASRQKQLRDYLAVLVAHYNDAVDDKVKNISDAYPQQLIHFLGLDGMLLI